MYNRVYIISFKNADCKMKKKIIFNMPQFVTGGAERVLVNAIEALKNDYDIHVIIRTVPKQCELFDQLKNLNVPVTCLEKLFPSLPKPKKTLKKIYWKIFIRKKPFKKSLNFMKKLCDENTLLWIDFLNFAFYKYAEELPSSLHKWCWIQGGSDFWWEIKDLNNKIKQYDKIIGISHTFTKNVKEKLPNISIETILNPLNVEKIARQSLADIPPNKTPFFVYVGRIDGDKDITTLINAYKLFYEKTHSATKLYLCGTGTQVTYYKNFIQELHLEKQIILKGDTANPFPYMRQSKALILSSFSEGYGMVLLEAMICGTIPVSSDCVSGPREILANGKRGVLFEPQNTVELAQILEKTDAGMIQKQNFEPYWHDFIQQHTLNAFKHNFKSILNKK